MGTTRIDFKRTIGSERIAVMLPLNVVMVARIHGPVDRSGLITALERLRSRHPLLAVRVKIEGPGPGSFTTDDVPAIPVQIESRDNEHQWKARVEQEIRTSFPMDTGPLVRCTLIQSSDVSELVLCAHHAVSDGMSLVYLIRDILEQLTHPSDIDEPLIPPALNDETVPAPPTINRIPQAILRLINRAWRRKNRRFDVSMMSQLHERYWQKNRGVRLCCWQLSETDTTRFVKRCRAEGVTVNSAIWAACLTAQQDVQGNDQRFRQRAGLAISTRNKLKVPVGDAFGFYASSHQVPLKRYQNRPFWEAARIVHTQLKRSIDAANPFQMLWAQVLDPTLMDSLYFSKYGLYPNGISNWLLRKMRWDRINYGFAITNVGRIDIPTNYGDLTLNAVYGPVIYSDVNEKTVGVMTVGNRLTVVMTYDEHTVNPATARQLNDACLIRIREASAEPRQYHA